MTWISLVCLLALSSSALANYGQSNGYGASTFARMPSLVNVMREQHIRRPIMPVVEQRFIQQDLPTMQAGYGSSNYAEKAFPMHNFQNVHQGYGAAPRFLSFDQQPQQQVQQLQILTEADQLCRGQVAETVIPLDNGRKFVVCLDDGKGAEQYCPKGLYYHMTSRRCERKLGPLENSCLSQPCLNGGQCAPTESHYQCQCAPGFDGVTCELDARICQTQQPCGQSPDARCQSFRAGAALQHVCILQDGLAYGLSAQQAVASPCNGADGPQALSVSDKGFIMCDGERMFVESCPGGTIWDDLNKACVWPDMQADIPQIERSNSYGSYGQARQLIAKPSYEQSEYGQARQLIAKPSYEQSQYGQARQLIAKPSYEQSQYGQARQLIAKPSYEQSQYGQARQLIAKPSHEQSQHGQSYGAELSRPSFEQKSFLQAPAQGYGSQITIQPVAEKNFAQSLGTRMNFQQPAFQQQQQETVEAPVQGYGSQITIQPAVESRKITQLPTQNWESQRDFQSVVEQPKPFQSSGY